LGKRDLAILNYAEAVSSGARDGLFPKPGKNSSVGRVFQKTD
jgi:hypothetical protein